MTTKKALVVAINDYGGPPNDLPSCVKDANAFVQMLRDNYDFADRDVRTLLDAQATVSNVEKELDWLVGTPSMTIGLSFTSPGTAIPN